MPNWASGETALKQSSIDSRLATIFSWVNMLSFSWFASPFFFMSWDTKDMLRQKASAYSSRYTPQSTPFSGVNSFTCWGNFGTSNGNVSSSKRGVAMPSSSVFCVHLTRRYYVHLLTGVRSTLFWNWLITSRSCVAAWLAKCCDPCKESIYTMQGAGLSSSVSSFAMAPGLQIMARLQWVLLRIWGAWVTQQRRQHPPITDGHEQCRAFENVHFPIFWKFPHVIVVAQCCPEICSKNVHIVRLDLETACALANAWTHPPALIVTYAHQLTGCPPEKHSY